MHTAPRFISCRVGIADDSPETFEALWAQYQTGLITVNTAHSDTAIYGRDGNATFRVFHDLGAHYLPAAVHRVGRKLH